MKSSTFGTAAILFLTVLAGCSSFPNNMPLVFGEDITLGISIGASATNQGGDLTLGFKSKDVAIIPVIAASGVTPTLIQSEITNSAIGNQPEKKTKDAYSVLGTFSTTTDSNGNKVGLGKFFATGQAATYLAGGFAAAMGASAVSATASAVPAKKK
jgi:hypothetical protein